MSASDQPRLRIGHATVKAGDTAALHAAIAAANERERMKDLPDTLNPALIDPAKADAFAAALVRTPAIAAPLSGRILLATPMSLRIGTSSPASPASFAAPFALEVTSEHGDVVIASAKVPVDCTQARDRAAEARRRTEEAERQYQAAKGDAIMPIRLRKQALSRAWIDNASAYAACVPGDAAAKADRDAADRAMRDSTVGGGSME